MPLTPVIPRSLAMAGAVKWAVTAKTFSTPVVEVLLNVMLWISLPVLAAAMVIGNWYKRGSFSGFSTVLVDRLTRLMPRIAYVEPPNQSATDCAATTWVEASVKVTVMVTVLMPLPEVNNI